MPISAALNDTGHLIGVDVQEKENDGFAIVFVSTPRAAALAKRAALLHREMQGVMLRLWMQCAP